ncbi:hypothetical protein MHAE_10506 [Mycobacterium haemophilum DSM 44634]
MTAALHDEVVTAAPAPRLTVVRAASSTQIRAPKKAVRRLNDQPFGAGGDPLVDGAAHLLSIPVRHLYAVLLRIGLLEIQVQSNEAGATKSRSVHGCPAGRLR